MEYLIVGVIFVETITVLKTITVIG